MKRGPAPPIKNGEYFSFLCINVSYYSTKAGVPIIRLFGATAEGISVCVEIDDFKPYFYADCEANYQYHEELNSSLLSMNRNLPSDRRCVLQFYETLKTPFYEYQPEGHRKFSYIEFASIDYLKQARSLFEAGHIVKDTPVVTYESKTPYVLRFMVDHKIGGCMWIQIGKWRECPDMRVTSQYKLVASKWAVMPEPDRQELGDIRILHFDLEASKQGGRGFVNAEYDPVTQIGCTVTSTKYGIMKRCVFSLGTLSILPHEVEGIAMGTNRQGVLLGLRDLIREYDVDIFSGYNIDSFDWPYLYQWAKTLLIDGEFMDFSRDLDKPAYIKKKKFNSRGTGTRVDLEMGCVGRCNIDTMKVIKTLVKLRSYGLGNVAQLELGHSKVEMPYYLIPEYQNGTDEQRAHLAYYCWMDAHLCHELWEKRQILVMCVQQARVCKIPIDWLYSRGQQIRGDSQLLRRCQLRNFIIPTGVKKGEKPDGAKVLDPIRGFHTDPVVTLDLQSLYPTIIRFYNICYSTVKALKWLKANLKPTQYNVPPGADYGFVDETVLAGILPEAETDLAAFRQQAKAMLKAAKTLDDKVLYNKLQEAIKLVMNSLYGYTYADSLPDGRLTAAVTGWGREILGDIKTCVESTFPGSEVIYGDSVTPDTAILIRSGRFIRYVRIDDIPRSSEWYWSPLDGKEYATPELGIEVWTRDGVFTPLKRLIRHYSQKNIYRILTHTGCVQVTEDHSLVTDKGDKVSPLQVKVGDRLLHSTFPKNPFTYYDVNSVLYNCPYAMGLFYGDGSCGTYDGKSTWAINNTNTEFLKRARRELNLHYMEMEFPTYDTLESSGVYKLCMTGENVRFIVKIWRKMFYTSQKEKKIPDELFHAPDEIIDLFMQGYYDADGDKDPHGYRRFDNKGQIGAAGLTYLSAKRGYKYSLNTRKDKLDIYRITTTKKSQRKDPWAIKKIEFFGHSDDYVYDLETNDHHFVAGVGNIVVHNTDSVFVKFKGATDDEAWDLGQRAAEICTTMLNNIRTSVGKSSLHLLQREKKFNPFVLVSKKRYGGAKQMSPNDPITQAECGMETVRRDNALFASEPLAKCLQMILMEGDHKGERCVAYIHEQIRDLFAGRVDISKLIISKNLSKDKYKDKQPHVEVAKKMRERNGDGPVTGDRVKFVMTARVKGTINADAAEDPIYAMENRLPLDYDYYIENQMMKPLLRIMHLILDPTNPEKKLPKNEKDLKNLKAYKILFTGEHMRYRNQHVVQRTTGISSFFVTQNRCLSCRAQCGTAALCKSCNVGEIRQTLQQDLGALQERQAQCLETCRACVKDPNATNIPCANNDCDNFYRRIKVVVDIEDVVGKLNRF
jgi:DNA polymerase elongation subunit (family B)